MKTLRSLYEFAERNQIEISEFQMERSESLSMPLGDIYCIAIDPTKLRSNVDRKVKVAHELGHCATNSFYNKYAACDIRGKHEERASRWAIKKLIPKDELIKAVSNGYIELWELAEFFDVTCEFMEKAIQYYKMQESV